MAEILTASSEDIQVELKPAKAHIKPGKLFIGGEFVDALSERTFETRNPATGAVLTDVAEAGVEDVELAVRAARKAFEDGSEWRKMTPRDRGRILWKLSELIRTHAEELSELETLDTGKPIFESSRFDIPLAAECFEYYAGWPSKIAGETLPNSAGGDALVYTLREPVGVCGQIIPWNFPLQMLAWKAAPALACGNTVVMKPAEQTPLSALRLAELTLEAEIPAGVFNVVTGFGPTTGAALVANPGVDKIAFTGSVEIGKEIMRGAAGTLKRVSLELGGKSPNIVFADADLEAAARGALTGIFYNKGEVCAAGSRLLVEERVHDELVERVVERARTLKVGDPLDKATRMGPVVSRQQYET